MIGIIAQTCEKYLTIRHYFRRSAREDLYRQKADASRAAELPVAIVKSNNLYGAKWLGPIFVGVYIACSAPLVLNKDLELGFFLATVSIINDMSDLFLEAYVRYQKIAEVTEPLLTLSVYFNMETDLPVSKKIAEHELNWVHGARLEVMKRPPPPPEAKLLRTDLIPIVIENLDFGYEGVPPIVKNVNLRIMQGTMVAVTGAHGSGKASFLKILGRIQNPTRGNIFIAPHLRILFVSQEPTILLDQTLWENLTLGCPDGVDPSLVNSILGEMGMDRVATALEHFQSLQNPTAMRSFSSVPNSEPSQRDLLLGDGLGAGGGPAKKGDSQQKKTGFDPGKMRKELATWFENLNYSEKVKIHFARAFIMNPEILVMHRPLYHFSDELGHKVLGMIKEHHSNRGFCQPLTTIGRRRPRTVFMTTDSDWEDDQCDVCWRINNKNSSIREERPNKLTTLQPLDQARKVFDDAHAKFTNGNGNGNGEPREGTDKSGTGNSWKQGIDWCFTPTPRQQLPHEK
jgi:ABC-type multidrug transport system fused ATPase/permease subunit